MIRNLVFRKYSSVRTLVQLTLEPPTPNQLFQLAGNEYRYYSKINLKQNRTLEPIQKEIDHVRDAASASQGKSYKSLWEQIEPMSVNTSYYS